MGWMLNFKQEIYKSNRKCGISDDFIEQADFVEIYSLASADIRPEDMMYHRDWWLPAFFFFFLVVKLKVVCLAVEKSGQFYLVGDIYNRIVFLKKVLGMM